ncbi:dockerin type I domain-containing protein [Acetobacterium sp.]|uniref:dockerin type I domain-containing protein n=1 Tax=Acetobacterium sp. TaxID=1872094 RepID=UPI0035946F0D
MKKIIKSLMVLALLFVMVLPTILFAEEKIDGVTPLNEAINANDTNNLIEGEINFPDPNLFKALLENEVDQNGDGVITQEEMKIRTWLDLVNQNITNLEGLNYATELSSLNLYGNTEITNIESIKGLTNLKTLDLGNTGVSDADRMSFLRLSDQNCSLGFTTFQELKPTGLSDAYTISSSDESIVVASIDNSNWWDTKIKLESKKIGVAQVSISIGSETKAFTVTVNPPPAGTIQFQDENLYHVLINNGVDTNFDGMINQEEMKVITFLDLQNQQITNLSGLEYATGLTHLVLGNNPELSNVDSIKGLSNLNYLFLHNTSVSDADKMSFISLSDQNLTIGMSASQYIEPEGISDAFTIVSSDESVVGTVIDNTNFQGQIKLEGKKVGSAQISLALGAVTKEFTVTVNPQPEGTINFEDPNLSSALLYRGIDRNGDGAITQQEIKGFGGISLNNCDITSLTGLEYATELTQLDLSGNPSLVNVEPIKGLTKLEELNLRNTGVSDADKMSFVRLSDQNCALGFKTFQVVKPRGLTDSYSVSSSDESIVVASIDNFNNETKINLDSKNIGTAQISVNIGSESKSFTVTVGTPPEGTIQFEDVNLLSALINQGVDQNNDGAITQDEMKDQSWLNLGGWNLTSLSGLEYATALDYLYLYDNTNLSNIEAIKGLTNLQTLDLSNTSVSDVDRMSFVRLSNQNCVLGCTIFQIINPQGLSNTFTVNSSDETVVTASIDQSDWWQTKIKLEGKKTGTAEINVKIGNESKSFIVTVNASPAGTINFEDPNLLNALLNRGVDENNDGVITEEEIHRFSGISLSYQNITNLSGLEYATELDWLDLSGNPDLVNVDPIKGLTKLTTLNLEDTGVSDTDKMSFVHLSDQNCVLGFATFQVIKPTGLSDSYTVSSSDASIASASIDHSNSWETRIKMEAKKIGSAQITVNIGTVTKTFTVTVNNPPAGTIQFADVNLLNALINQGVDENSDGAITQVELKKRSWFSLADQNITNLSGLEYATVINGIELNGNTELSNIDPIKGFTQLYHVDLRGTKVSDADRMSFMRLSDQTCAEGFSTFQVIKPYGLSDDYVVSSSDEAVASSTIDNSTGEGKIKLTAKKTGTAVITVLIGTEEKSFTVTVNAQPEGTIQFPDANLYNGLINRGFDQNSDGAITQEEMKNQSWLDLNNQNITNLAGLEYATSLNDIDLSGNTILNNIDPLKGLTQLYRLDLMGTKVSDADRISFLRLSDRNGISGMDYIQYLYPYGLTDSYTVTSSDETIVAATINNGTSSNQSYIKLETKKPGTVQINVGIGSEIKSFTMTVNAQPEGTISFNDANLFNALLNSGVDINNDGAITQEEMKTQEYLYLYYYQITDLTGLEYATELRELVLCGNSGLKNIDPIKGLTQLEYLDLRETMVSNADKMSFVRLEDQSCVLGSNPYMVIKPQYLSDDYTISSSDDDIVSASIDYSNGSGQIKLVPQKIGTAKITVGLGLEKKEFTVTVKAAPEGTIQFEDVNLFNALISNGVDENSDGAITQNEMKNVNYLYFNFNGNQNGSITTLEGMEFATELESLVINYHYQLSDITPLLGLSKLEYVSLNGTAVTDADKAKLLKLADITGFEGYGSITTIYPRGLASDYTITSSNSDIVEASIIPSLEPQMRLIYKKQGTATITVTMTEGGSQSFQVTVGALPGDAVRFEDPNLSAALIREGVDANNDGVITGQELTVVEELNLDYCGIVNLSGLEGATALKYLSLSDNPELVDIEPVRLLANQLTHLYLYNTGVSPEKRMSLLRLDDLTLNQAERITWKAQPIGVLEVPQTAITLANPDIAETYDYYYEDIYITGKNAGTTLATVNYEGATRTFSLTVMPTMTERILGDVDGNGKVTAFDALMALQIATGKKDGTAEEIKAGDVGNSGKVEAFDALRILQFATGKITKF